MKQNKLVHMCQNNIYFMLKLTWINIKVEIFNIWELGKLGVVSNIVKRWQIIKESFNKTIL